MRNPTRPLMFRIACCGLAPCAAALAGARTMPHPQDAFVNWETPHVSPLALSADGAQLFAVNTADARLEVFDVSGQIPVSLFAVPVGLDPVSVRLRTATEAWVVNHVSDTVSIIDLTAGNVVATIATLDEPADVVFAGTPQRAFVSCSQANAVMVFDPADLSLAPLVVEIEAEEPRALAVSADGAHVYAALFESGNGTTVLGGGHLNPAPIGIQNVVSDPLGPYGGQNPPPNSGATFDPPQNPLNRPPPRVGHIVRLDDQGRWMDGNGRDWTDLVSGANASHSDRPVGWTLLDRDVAVIDTQTLAVTYRGRLMNVCMALAVHPATGDVTVVGTEATNEIRFEPNLTGTFVRVHLAFAAPGGGAATVVDMNPHLDYTTSNVPQATRDLALGDPRGIVWNAAGTRAYVSGMGSNNVVVLDGAGARVGAPIEVGAGPTGVVLGPSGGRLYTLNKFDGSISVVDTGSAVETARVRFHDPTPAAIRAGRPRLYDTHASSGLGQVACGSCHVDARIDRLAWDLGDPTGEIFDSSHQNRGFGHPALPTVYEDPHPMKGPMVTQTLQDIIGKEPLHWRGDKNGIEDFNGAFVGLQGDDAGLSDAQMAELEAFLATITFPPNPFRNFDNSLPTDVPLAGHYSNGRFSPAGLPLPNGDATRGLALFMPPNLLDGTVACVTCHTLPTGISTDSVWNGSEYVPLAPDANGNRNHAVFGMDGFDNRNLKVPQLRNMYERVGMELTQPTSRAGAGFLHDGSIPSLAHFIGSPVFSVHSDQEIADLIAFMLAFAGSDLPVADNTTLDVPPGTPSLDTHAAVGAQITVHSGAPVSAADREVLLAMQGLADAGAVGLVAKGRLGGIARGFFYIGNHFYQSDRRIEVVAETVLAAQIAPGSEVTWTVVPSGTERRIGVDRDADGAYDRDELDAGTDPADPASFPGLGTAYCTPAVQNSTGAPAVMAASGSLAVVDQDLRLHATELPPGQFGYFLASRTQGFVANAGGSAGNLCLGGDIGRFNALVQSSGPAGSFSITVDMMAVPVNPSTAIAPGDTWNFQAWFRDVGGTSNLTDGLGASFH